MDEFPRAPTREERDLLDFMIEANKEDADQLRLLFQDTRVLSLCFCGCGGPELSTNSELVPIQTWKSPLPDEATAEVAGEKVNIMLFVTLKHAWFELHWIDLDNPREHPRLPRPDELEATQTLIYPGPTLVLDPDAIALQESPPQDSEEDT